MLQAIIFDFDGVIADSEPLHYRAFARVMQPLGFAFTYEDYMARYIGFDDRDAFAQLLRDANLPGAEDPTRIAALVAEKGDAFAAVVGEGVTSFPGTIDFVRQAAASLPIAIASGATRRDIDLILGRLGLAEVFATIVTADMVRRSKPDPETYTLALERLRDAHPQHDIRCETGLAIEDTAAGITSARAAGLWTLGLTTTGSSQLVSKAHRVLKNLEGLQVDDLQQWFG